MRDFKKFSFFTHFLLVYDVAFSLDTFSKITDSIKQFQSSSNPLQLSDILKSNPIPTRLQTVQINQHQNSALALYFTKFILGDIFQPSTSCPLEIIDDVYAVKSKNTKNHKINNLMKV